ncbi:ATP-binding cassette domain-containing protein [Aeromonas bivalvium]|uniref:ATP-binding cassette domain-containing protein n=1 Tax=Aeromonas bivalvium TaxID=440079 RepID=UPI0038D1BC3C
MDHPELSASWLSRLFYHWTSPLQRKGLREIAVSLDDLYPLLPQDSRDARADEFLALTARQPVRPWLITRHIWRHYGSRIGLLTLLQGLAMLATLASPWLLNHVMTQLGAGATTAHKLLLALALFASVLAAGMLSEHALQLSLKMHVPIRRLLAEALLAKVMKLGGKSFDDRAGGKVQNLINRDVWDITWILADPAMPVTLLLQLAGTVALLVWQVGHAGLVGCAVLVLLLLLSTRLIRRMNQQEQRLKHSQDERNGILAEYIKKLRLVRQNGLGPFFTRTARRKRQQELRVLGRVLRLDAINDALMLGTPLLVTLATFITYLASGQRLTLPQVFTTIALFAVLRIPMQRLPYLIRTLINFNTGFSRLCELLNSPEQHRSLDDERLARGAIVLEGVSTHHRQHAVLTGVNLAIAPGELVGITGATGAGKSCLLHLIAGFDDEFEGEIRRHGRVAHLGHKPWLMNDSIRNNILFGQPWDEARYRWVLEACTLNGDLALLAHGDQTLVGELGTRLSGGQQQRVALARALYTQADILLLDNPLSALDPLVAAQVLRLGLSFRPGPTRLLVSHDPEVLARCDRVFAIEGASLTELAPRQLVELPGSPPDAPLLPPREQERFSEEKMVEGKVDWGLFGFLWRRLQAPGLILLILVLTLGQEGLRIASDLWLGGRAEDMALAPLIGIYVALGLGSLLCITLVRVLNYKLGLRLAWSLFDGMLGRISRAPMAFFDKVPQGRILNRFDRDLAETQETLLPMLVGLVGMLISVLLQVLVIGINLPLLLLVAPLVGWALYVLQRRYRAVQLKLRRQASVLRSPLYISIGETIRGAPALRLAGAERYALDQVLVHYDNNLRSWYTTTSINRWLGMHQTLLSAALVGAVAIMVALSDSTLFGAVAITYAFTTSAMLNALIRNFAEVEQMMNAVERVREYSEIESERQQGAPLQMAHPAVRFADLGLRYPEASQWALHGVNFELAPGEKVGVCGRTGAGKSSLLGALQAMYPATQGEIYYGDQPLSTLAPEAVRDLYDTVSQTPLTFFGTLRANLAPLADPEGPVTPPLASKMAANVAPMPLPGPGSDQHPVRDRARQDERLMEALRRVGLGDRCAGRLDEDLDQLQLSAGETQLLVIARILLSHRPLIVLDEATSDLSHGGMREMAELLYRYRPEASYLVIAHHLEPLLSLDKVVVMEAGTVVEQGSPVSLLANPGSRFHQLFAGQVNRQIDQIA